jgi:hypothetical protein
LPTNSASPQPTLNSEPIANPEPSPMRKALELVTPIVIVFLVSVLVGVTVAKIKGNKIPVFLTKAFS